MKVMKAKVVFFTTVMILVSAIAFAGGKPVTKKEVSTSVELKSNNSVIINLQNLGGKTMGFDVYSQDGIKVCSGNLNGKERGKFRHNLNYLEDGLYTYEVTDGESVVYSVKILKEKNGSAELRCADKQVCTAITPSAANNRLVEVRLHKSKNATATIVVSDEMGEAISRKMVKEGQNVVLNYDLTSFPAGNYTIKVLDGRKLAGYRKVNL